MLKLCKGYTWRGINSKGLWVRGRSLVDRPELLRPQLERQGIIPTQIKANWQLVPLKRAIPLSEVANFSQQLASLLKAGLSLSQALVLLIDEYSTKPTMQALLMCLHREVESGIALSVSLRNHPKQFTLLYCNLVQIGEQSGKLATTFSDLAHHQHKLLHLKQSIRKALFYPIALMSIASFVFILLMLWVIPQFEQLFSELTTPLPKLTRWVIQISRLLKAHYLKLIGGMSVFCIALSFSRETLKQWIRRFNYRRLPGIGPALYYSLLSQFSRTLGVGLKAGLPLVDSLTATAKIVGHTSWEVDILKVRDAIMIGTPLDQALRAVRRFPTLLLQMIVVAQVAGNLDETLHRLADLFDQKADKLVTTLIDLLEPALILTLGLFIGGLMIALYWPLFNIGLVA